MRTDQVVKLPIQKGSEFTLPVKNTQISILKDSGNAFLHLENKTQQVFQFYKLQILIVDTVINPLIKVYQQYANNLFGWALPLSLKILWKKECP